MLTTILLIVAALIGLAVAIVIVLASGKPDAFRVERRATMSASPEVIFPQLADLHRWAAWSPWEKLDPAMERTYGGPASGEGASYSWRGNNKAGEGKMTITESRPSERVALRLEFIKPFRATNTAVFTLVKQPSGAEVTWSLEGKHNFMSKVFTVFVDMDSVVGKDFERGLAELKRVSEAAR
jgi:hypothetical protein